MVIGIADGYDHSLALKSDGTVIAWGAGGPGQSGQGNYGQSTVPANLNGVMAIAGGGYHTLVIKSNGTVVAWGAGGPGQQNGSVHWGQSKVPTNLNGVIAVAAGFVHSLTLKSNGTVVAWGSDSSSQISVPSGLSNVIAIAAGQYHNLALKSDGTVVAWGYNYAGQTIVPAGLTGVIGIAGGRGHSLVLKSNGTVVAWGDNYYGQTNVPVGLGSVINIAAGAYHSLALKSDGTVMAWGAGGPGQSGYEDYGQSTVPASLNGVIAIAAGGDHSLALAAGPMVQAPPASQTVAAGSTVEFSVDVSGTPPFSYRWLFNTTNSIVGATNALLQVANVQPFQSGAYCVVVTNAFGAVTSSPAMLTVITVPVILSAPTNQTTWTGTTVDFSVMAVGVLPMAYQWFLNGTNAVPGATNSTLQLTNVQPEQAGAYAVVITNVYGSVTSAPAALVLFPPGTVLAASETALRAAMAGGGTVTFACDGVIVMGSGRPIGISANTILDGSGHQVTICGNAEGLFSVSTNVTFSMMNLTIANSRSAYGACVENWGGTLNLMSVGFYTNTADANASSSAQAAGGAIVNRGGTVNATNCTFSGNSVRILPPASGGSTWAGGGAIRNESGQVNLVQCVFTENRANGVMGPSSSPDIPPVPGTGAGGAIHNSGTLTLDLCTFANNSATGCAAPGAYIRYPGSAGGAGAGGAILNLGTVVARRINFLANTAASGNGGAGGSYDPRTGPGGYPGGPAGQAGGGAIFNLGTLSVDTTAFASNTVSGGTGGAGSAGPSSMGFVGPGFRGGTGGAGQGAALFNGGTTLVANSTFAWNTALGGGGGRGGNGGYNTTGSGGGGGQGGNGGVAWGVLCDTNGLLSLTNCTVAFNHGIGGSGGAGGAGGNGTPPGQPGPAGTNGVAGGGISSTGGRLVNMLLATNSLGGNSIGTLVDAGHNLSSDASCAFTNAGSLNNTDPKLGPLADNGGPTLTMALLPGSPAIDAGDTAAAPPTDQRGHLRPVGSAADMGAYEYGSTPRLRISPPQAGAVEILLYDLISPSCRLLTSTNLADWLPMATNQISADGTALFHVNVGPVGAQEFFRVALP